MSKIIGDRKFYRDVFKIAIPVMIQNGITNFVSVLDNVMVGRVGTEPMSGVAISNQLLFVFNLFVFGAISGVGIFTAQFYGANDHKGVRYTFRMKMVICALVSILSIGLFMWKGEQLISLFLSDDSTGDVAATLAFGKSYLVAMFAGLPAFAFSQAYSGTLREMGETRLPMVAGVVAVAVNLFFNWVLIFGKLGAPKLGVVGAAVATVISRYVELIVVAVYTRAKAERFPFIVGAYKSLYVPGKLMGRVLLKGTPLTINEVMWAMGVSFLAQCYSTRGLSVVAAMNISNTVTNLFNIVFLSLGNVVAIIVGQQLGANKLEEAKTSAYRLIATGVALSTLTAALMAVTSPFVPMLYNTTDSVRSLATKILCCAALYMPVAAFVNNTYFTLRSGGKTFVTFMFDSAFMWLIVVPFAWVLSRKTAMPIIPLYLCCSFIDLIKCVVGFIMVKKGIWVNNIIEKKAVEIH